ncbi:MAG: c-type cytochrome [Planctomycetes bacterium]|nr:c-type cytochrome [Planctomycetota bacterium]
MVALVVGLAAMAVAWPAPEPIPEPTEPELRALVADARVVATGRSVYVRYCVTCHGTVGQGAQGPNLRDDLWIKGSDMTDLVRSIGDGNPARGMVAWKTFVSRSEVHALAAYIASLHGTEDGSGKTAEGTRAPIGYWPPRGGEGGILPPGQKVEVDKTPAP